MPKNTQKLLMSVAFTALVAAGVVYASNRIPAIRQQIGRV